MTDRPASWRMPTPKQMEKLAAAVGREPRRIPTPGPGDAMPPEYWEAVLRDPLADASPMPPGRLDPDAAAVRNSPARSEGVVLPLRPHRRDPEGRCRPPLRARRRSGRTSVSGCWTTPASSEPAAMKRTAAGRCSNECGRTQPIRRPRATQSAGDIEDGDLRLSPTIQ